MGEVLCTALNFSVITLNNRNIFWQIFNNLKANKIKGKGNYFNLFVPKLNLRVRFKMEFIIFAFLFRLGVL